MTAKKKTTKKKPVTKKSTKRKPVAKKKTTTKAGAEPGIERFRRAEAVAERLSVAYPDATCELDHTDALSLLVATILSAQSTDENVNKVTPKLFAKYPTARALADADPEELQEVIRSTGFFRQKAKNVQGACRRIVEHHGGEVPDTMEELLELPGVARKTANVILGTWFGKNRGLW